ncbi:MAG: hypothetical protein ACKPEN_23540 [Planktothrix sp.]|uniref:hypothetical protein n=1 Tax=Planktothrix sp. TaxID=3088171 RepID=UPI0038D405B1
MKIKTIKTPNFDLWSFHVSSKFNLCIYFYTFNHWFVHECFDFFCVQQRGRQVLGVNLPLIYIQLITPVPLIWVTEDELFNFALNQLKNRLNDIEDNLADYLLNDDKELDFDAVAESQQIYQLLSFYGRVE